MPFFPSTLRCGSVFMACPTNQANFLICHFFKLSSCHLQVVPEEPSAPSNCQREIKYQNNLCTVSQNHFSSVILPTARMQLKPAYLENSSYQNELLIQAESDSFHESLSLKAINSRYIRTGKNWHRKQHKRWGPLSLSGDVEVWSKLEKSPSLTISTCERELTTPSFLH